MQARTKARRTSDLPDVNEALKVIQLAEDELLESPDADYYFSDGLSE
jgi:tRNA isopentenyl-2-thiomethyl-A-37 hydroxylase MiaE